MRCLGSMQSQYPRPAYRFVRRKSRAKLRARRQRPECKASPQPSTTLVNKMPALLLGKAALELPADQRCSSRPLSIGQSMRGEALALEQTQVLWKWSGTAPAAARRDFFCVVRGSSIYRSRCKFWERYTLLDGWVLNGLNDTSGSAGSQPANRLVPCDPSEHQSVQHRYPHRGCCVEMSGHFAGSKQAGNRGSVA